MSFADLLTLLSGTIVGLILGLIGGGGSVLAVPLLVYVVGVSPAHVALGTSALSVALTALVNLIPHARAHRVKWPCAFVFAVSGMIGAWAGSSVAKTIDGDKLLVLFGLLMLFIGSTMLFGRSGSDNPDVYLNSKTARKLLPRLIPAGFGVGVLSGFFGIGGGFLIVPGLMLATGMPLAAAAATSLVSVFAFGATTAGNYALSGLVDWRLAAVFIIGGALGGVLGAQVGKWLGKSKNALRYVFSVVVLVVGVYVVWRGMSVLL